MMTKKLENISYEDKKFLKLIDELYKEFMEKISSIGFTKNSKDTPTDGKVWYLSHHGVYHPAKSSKIPVVFDWSPEYVGRAIKKTDGTSLSH